MGQDLFITRRDPNIPTGPYVPFWTNFANFVSGLKPEVNPEFDLAKNKVAAEIIVRKGKHQHSIFI